MLGLYSGQRDENFFWTNDALISIESARIFYAGKQWHNSGGDRTWLALERKHAKMEFAPKLGTKMHPLRMIAAAATWFLLLGLNAYAQDSIKALTTNADFYVASNGSDQNPGTREAPFATLGRARNAVRVLIATGLNKDLLVLIHKGVYWQTETLTFGPADSGTADHSITYAAAPGEQVEISGGRRINGFKKGQDEIWTTQIPEVKQGGWYFRQLFIGGVRATRARTPNAGVRGSWWTITSSSASKENPPAANASVALTVSGKIGACKNPTDVELVYMQNNESARKRVGALDVIAQSLTLALPNRWTPKVFTYDWALSVPFANKPCYMENALEMLDQPGEWYLDRITGILHYWPRTGEDLNQAEVIAPVVQRTMLVISGEGKRPVTNLHFSGLRVRYVDWPLPDWGYMGMFCCNVAVLNNPNPGHRPIEAEVEFDHANRCSFSDGAILDGGGMGLCLREGTSEIAVEGNEIGNLGGGGVAVGWANVSAGYTVSAPTPQPGEYEGYRFSNNFIHDCGEDYFGAVGIFLMGAGHTAVVHNLIRNTAYIGIIVAGTQDPKVKFGGDNLIEFNHVSNAMETTIDGAGIYVTFAQNGHGTVIRGNVVHDTFGNPNHEGADGHKWGDHPPCAGLYLDGDTHGGVYEQNVFYRNFAAGPLIFDNPDDNRDAQDNNRWVDNLFFKESTPPAEFIEAVQRSSGLEPRYAARLTKIAGGPCLSYILGDSAPESAWSAIQYDLPIERRGVIQIFLKGNYRTGLIQIKPLGLGETLYQLKAYSCPVYQGSVWGPGPKGPGKMAFLGAVQPRDITTMGLSSPVSGRRLHDKGFFLKPDMSPQVIWISYHQ